MRKGKIEEASWPGAGEKAKMIIFA